MKTNRRRTVVSYVLVASVLNAFCSKEPASEPSLSVKLTVRDNAIAEFNRNNEPIKRAVLLRLLFQDRIDSEEKIDSKILEILAKSARNGTDPEAASAVGILLTISTDQSGVISALTGALENHALNDRTKKDIGKYLEPEETDNKPPCNLITGSDTAPAICP